MKKLLILLALIPVFLLGQDPGGVDLVNLGTANQGDGDPLRTAFDKTNKNISYNESTVSTLNNSTIGTQGITITFSGDTAFMTQNGNTLKFLAIGSEALDVTPPTVYSVEVGELSSDTVVIVFSETMETDSVNQQFTLTEDGNPYGIGIALFSGSDSTFKIPLDSTAEVNKGYAIAYTRPGASDFQDPSGNKLATFTGRDVVNNIETPSDIYSWMAPRRIEQPDRPRKELTRPVRQRGRQ
jgi:hypothetical protein